jgi:hypothetical protein
MIEFSGHTHEVMGSGIPQKDIVLLSCADMVFAYIDKDDRIGTFCEISAAAALNKPILATWSPGVPPNYDQSTAPPWFVEELVTYVDSTERSLPAALFSGITEMEADLWRNRKNKAWREQKTRLKQMVQAL